MLTTLDAVTKTAANSVRGLFAWPRSGDIYCVVLNQCHPLADLPRMRAWAQSMERWCTDFAAFARTRSLGIEPQPGREICIVCPMPQRSA